MPYRCHEPADWGGSKIIAFPDTNVLLRAQPLKQIDWRALLNVEEVELVVARGCGG